MTKSTELYACLYANEFPAQAMLRLRPELRKKPFVVMDGEPPLQRVCSLNSRARTLGVAYGMTKVEIDTFSSVTVLPRSLAEEHKAKTAMLECASMFSPRVEDRSNDNAFLCVVDIVGTEKLFGSPNVLGNVLLERVRMLRITACIAIASNVYAAICIARGTSPRNQVTIIPLLKESSTLAPLKLEVLDLTEEQAETFSLWGIHTLGMLAALPEKALISRMGQAGKKYLQLARGELPHLFLPMESPFILEEYTELDTPVEFLDSLFFVVNVLLEQLILKATAHVLALASVTIKLSLEDGVSHTRTVRSALPTTERNLWIKLLHLDLEAHPPLGAVLALALTAEPGSTSKTQLGLFSPPLPEPLRLDVTLARIRAIVGEDCVGRIVLKDTHQPGRFSIEPFTVPSKVSSEILVTKQRTVMRQLRPTEIVSATSHDQRPATFTFREKRYTVEHAHGPWLTGSDWWSLAHWDFEQWDLVTHSQDGVMLCCCLIRDLTKNCWQMAALYD